LISVVEYVSQREAGCCRVVQKKSDAIKVGCYHAFFIHVSRIMGALHVVGILTRYGMRIFWWVFGMILGYSAGRVGERTFL
jgi:hypothetical protein